MNNILIQAIKEQRLLELRYSGYSRTVQAHAYGRDKEGDEVIRCFQIAGGSLSGEQSGWKLLKVRDMFSLHLLEDRFTPQPKYSRGDKAMLNIFQQI